MVGFNRRFDPHFRAVRQAIDDGTIGAVEMVNITSRDPGAPPIDYIRRSGGIFRDMTIHDFDMARWLLGEEPVAVAAHAAVLTDKAIGAAGDFDSVNVLLETAGGRQCVISNSRRATYGYDQRIEVLGSKGMVAAKNQREVSIEIASGAGFVRPPLLDFFMTRYTAAYAAEIETLVAGLRDGTAIAPSGGGRPGGAGAGRRGDQVRRRGPQGGGVGGHVTAARSAREKRLRLSGCAGRAGASLGQERQSAVLERNGVENAKGAVKSGAARRVGTIA